MVRVLWGENWMMVASFLPYFGILIIFQALISTTGQIYLIIRVVAIIIGSFYSIQGIVIALVVSGLIITLPLNLHVGFYRTFGFSVSYIVKFWISKIIIGLLLFVSVIWEKDMWLLGIMSVYLFQLIYYQRHDLKKLNGLIKKISLKQLLKK